MNQQTALALAFSLVPGVSWISAFPLAGFYTQDGSGPEAGCWAVSDGGKEPVIIIVK